MAARQSGIHRPWGRLADFHIAGTTYYQSFVCGSKLSDTPCPSHRFRRNHTGRFSGWIDQSLVLHPGSVHDLHSNGSLTLHPGHTGATQYAGFTQLDISDGIMHLPVLLITLVKYFRLSAYIPADKAPGKGDWSYIGSHNLHNHIVRCYCTRNGSSWNMI